MAKNKRSLPAYFRILGIILYGIYTMLLDIALVYSAVAIVLVIALIGLPIAVCVGTTILIHKTIKEIK